MHMPKASEDIRRQAADWVVRLDRGCRDDERRAFDRWLAADPEHRNAYDAAYELWCELDDIAAALPEALTPPHAAPPASAPSVSATASTSPPADVVPIRRQRTASRRRAWGAMAAAVLLTLGLLAAPEIELRLHADLCASVGESITRVLEDGSTVQLNTDSAIAVRYTDDQRSIELLRGEAAFEVAHEAARPFVVQAGDSSVTALGTVFQVRADRDITVTVAEGRVRVRAGDDSAELNAGQQLSLRAGTLADPRDVDVHAAAAWRRGYLSFVERPLGEVVDELNRYTRGHILLTGQGLAERTVSGTFETARPEAALAALEQSLDLRVTRVTDRLILLRK